MKEWSGRMRPLLLALGTLLFLPALLAVDYEWYVSADGSDDADCGRNASNPCSSLTDILSASPSFSNASATCYTSGGAVDGRDSTTVYFLGEVNTVPAICLRNWTNVRIVGVHSNSTILIDVPNGGCRGFFEFIACTNVSIENLNFAFSVQGRATLLFEASQHVSVTECTFSVTAEASYGVWLRQSAGDIMLTGNVFFGRQSTEPKTSPRALEIRHGCTDSDDCNDFSHCVMPFDMDLFSFPDWSFSLDISDCVFRDLVSFGDPEDDYTRARQDSVAMRLQFGSYSENNQVYVRRTTFKNIQNTVANGVAVNFLGDSLPGMESRNNSVLFSNCIFIDNNVRYGGGISSYFVKGPIYSSLAVEKCVFLRNNADLEGGGVFAVFLSSGSTNSLAVTNSSFERNSALAGAAVFILNNAQWFTSRGLFDPLSRSIVVRATLTDCLFEDNKADITAGVIQVLRVQLYVYGISNFTSSTGCAVFLRLSFLTVEGEFTFRGNTGGSGGAISIRDGSRVNMTGVTQGYFLNNKAMLQGGAIYGDQDSTTELLTEYNHTAQFLLTSCFILFGNELQVFSTIKLPRRFTFEGNNATFEGQHIYSFSLRSCMSSNFVPAQVDQFFAFPNDGTVYHEVPANRDPLQSTGTGSNFLFFWGASVKCLKVVGSVTYLLPNCSNDLLQSTFLSNSDLDCSINALTEELKDIYRLPGSGLRPTTDNLIAPWASIAGSWMNPPGESRQQCPEPDPGNLVLSPAPGEQFDISILLADQLLNYVSDTVFMQVEGKDDSSSVEALLQLNGLQFGVRERVYFTPNRPLAGLALVGLPGARGFLTVTANSQIQDHPVILHIPFHLAHCPLGFFPPSTLRNASAAQDIIFTTVTQRISSEPDQPLACHCFTDSSLVTFSSLVQEYDNECIQGYTVQLSSSVWGGLFSKDGTPVDDLYPSTVPCPKQEMTSGNFTFSDNLTKFILDLRQRELLDQELNFDPVDVVPYLGLVSPGGGAAVMCFDTNVSEVINHKSKGVFTIEQCGQGYCRGDGRDTWLVANVSFPCAENRKGPLCGQCKSNYSVSLYSTRCRNCVGKTYQYYLSLIFTLVFGLLLVVLVLGFNIGATPTFDSFLFFTQSVHLMLAGRNDYEMFNFLAFFNPNFTFDLCVVPNLTALIRLILQYITPTYILLLLCIILAFTKFKYISRILGRHSILQGLWLLFLISYFNITITSFEILYCRRVGPTELDGVGQRRGWYLVQDPSVRCFQHVHLLFTIIAIAILLLFIVPVPIYLTVIMKKARWKPVADVFCSFYKDNRRWWIVQSLSRRLLLVLFGVFLQDLGYRHFFLLISITLILLGQVLTWPYKTLTDNIFAVFITWVLLIVAFLTQPQLYLEFDPSRIPSLTFVIATILLCFFLIVQEVLIRLLAKTTVGSFYKARICPVLKRYKKKMTNDLRVRKSRHFELEESVRSTTSTIIPAKTMIDATAYREPLLDSQYSGSVEDTQVTKLESATATASFTSNAGNKRPVYFFKKKKFNESEINPDALDLDDDKGMSYVPPSTTEVLTGGSRDLGLATSRSTIN